MSALVDPRGCLTPAGMAAVQRAPLGQAPAELAQHLATCARCQARLLAAGTGRTATAAGAADPAAGLPPGLVSTRRLTRTVVFVVAALVLAVAALALVAVLRPTS
jgi:hypothetical protein